MYKLNAANSTPAALMAAKAYLVAHKAVLASYTQVAPAPVSPSTNQYPVGGQEVSFAADTYQNLSRADKAHNKAVEAFLALYEEVKPS